MAERGELQELRSQSLASAAPGENLEQRVFQLENIVAGLQDTSQLEERVVKRVTEKVSSFPVAAPCEPPTLMVGSGRPLLPAFSLLEKDSPNGESRRLGIGRTWLLGEIYSETWSILDMLMDPRYRRYLPWSAKFVPLLILAFCLTSHWIMPWSYIPGFGPIFDKALGLVIALVAFKILSREAKRYRELLQP